MITTFDAEEHLNVRLWGGDGFRVLEMLESESVNPKGWFGWPFEVPSMVKIGGSEQTLRSRGILGHVQSQTQSLRLSLPVQKRARNCG